MSQIGRNAGPAKLSIAQVLTSSCGAGNNAVDIGGVNLIVDDIEAEFAGQRLVDDMGDAKREMPEVQAILGCRFALLATNSRVDVGQNSAIARLPGRNGGGIVVSRRRCENGPPPDPSVPTDCARPHAGYPVAQLLPVDGTVGLKSNRTSGTSACTTNTPSRSARRGYTSRPHSAASVQGLRSPTWRCLRSWAKPPAAAQLLLVRRMLRTGGRNVAPDRTQRHPTRD